MARLGMKNSSPPQGKGRVRFRLNHASHNGAFALISFVIRTVPYVFVKQELIGGHDDTVGMPLEELKALAGLS